MNTIDQVVPQSAGALTFSPDGVLFVGDSKLGALFAFETERGEAPSALDPFLFESIDQKIYRKSDPRDSDGRPAPRTAGQDLGGIRFPGRRRSAAQAGSVNVSPRAEVLPANTLRFYIHFPRSGEAHFDRDQLWLLDDEERAVPDPFLVLSQELWSFDGRRLTVLMEPGRIKRGFDPSHEPALVVGRAFSLVVTALGQTARHTFRVSDPVREALDETDWRLVSPTVGSLDPAVVHFDRVMDAALCEDEIAVLTSSREVAPTRVSLAPDGTSAQVMPSHPWRAEEHRLVLSERLEDVCGNRLGEALDHDLGAGGRPRDGVIHFTPRTPQRAPP